MLQTTKIRSHVNTSSSSPVSFYHRTDSLLFQFILSELIVAHHELSEIREMVQKVRTSLSVSEEFVQFLLTLSIALRKLTGAAQENMRLFSWNIEAGALTKLRNYCAFFSQNKEDSDRSPLLMHRYSNRSWLLCLQCLDCVRVLQHHLLEPDLPEEKIPEVRDLLNITTDKLFSQVQRFVRLIARIALNFNQDENVLYFFLQQHEEFNKIYGHNFVNSLFEKMFQKGVPEAGQFLLQKYGERGFHDLFPLIASKITELQVVVST